LKGGQVCSINLSPTPAAGWGFR